MCDVVGDVGSAAGPFVGRESVPVFVGARLLGGFLFALVEFPWQSLRAACVLLFGLAVRIQSTCRVTESTQRARELTPEIITKTIESFLSTQKIYRCS